MVGSIGHDVVVTTPRHPRPGETVMGTAVHSFPGGKGANQAIAASRAQAATRIAGCVGNDAAGHDQLRLLSSLGIDVGGVRMSDERSTHTAVIVVDSAGENTIVVVSGASELVDAGDAARIDVAPGDVVVCQFEIPQAAVRAALATARSRGATTVLNVAPAAHPIAGLLDLADVLVLNETEAALLLGRPVGAGDSIDSLIAVLRELRTAPDQVVLVTLGARGAVAVDHDEVVIADGIRVDPVDATGAGDCFTGNLAACLARGDDLAAAVRTANVAASLCVQRMGAGSSMPLRSETEDAARREP